MTAGAYRSAGGQAASGTGFDEEIPGISRIDIPGTRIWPCRATGRTETRAEGGPGGGGMPDPAVPLLMCLRDMAVRDCGRSPRLAAKY